MSSTQSPVRGLCRLCRAGIKQVLFYRSDLLFGITGMIIQVVLTVVVWRVVYGGHGHVAGISKTTAVAYAILAACLQTIVMPWQFSSIPLRIMRGQIGVDLTRPQSLIGQALSQTVGTMIGRLPIGLGGLCAGFVLGGLAGPASVYASPAWLLSTLLGVSNVLIVNLAVSMMAFWTLDIAGPMIVYRFGSALLSGSLIPIWFLPGWMRPIISWLPFQAQIYAPLSIWFGQRHGAGVAGVLVVQLAWVVVLWFILQAIWRRAVRKVVILGG